MSILPSNWFIPMFMLSTWCIFNCSISLRQVALYALIKASRVNYAMAYTDNLGAIRQRNYMKMGIGGKKCFKLCERG